MDKVHDEQKTKCWKGGPAKGLKQITISGGDIKGHRFGSGGRHGSK